MEGMQQYDEMVEKYQPMTEEDEAVRSSILQFINKNRDTVLTRDNTMAHLTASTVILNEEHSKMLMIHHSIYDKWTWQGGHADGDPDLLRVALKEAREETGLNHFIPMKQKDGNLIYRLDILPVQGHFKKGSYVAPHMHLNVAFVLMTKEKELVYVNEEETRGIEWVLLEEIDRKADEPEISPIYHKLISVAKKKQV